MAGSPIVAITGASSGIGASVARGLSERGYTPLLIARRKPALESVAQSLKGTSIIVDGDVNDSSLDAKVLAALNGRPLAGLVNNAGRYDRGAFETFSEADWARAFQTNLFSAARLTKSLLSSLSSHGGAIVNVSSTLGLRPVPQTSIYAATKAAMNNWTQALALELAPKVRVNCVCPGITDTPLHGFSEEQKRQLAQAQPLGRIGTPDEVAEAIIFLLESKWTTGAILAVDGGISLT
ncbi:MAG TPA: SDR family oxidoreductase [Bdellovibrionales bacterium]|nr:SDR family oxidoreductase [Bdellovibrionales bacterium]